MVHGALVDNRAWAPVVARLDSRIDTVTPQLSGYFPDETVPAEFSADRHVSELEDVVVRLARPVVVVGYSRGARLALELARRRDHVVALLLAEPGGVMEQGFMPASLWKSATASEAALARLALGESRNAACLYIEAGHGSGSFDRLPAMVQRCAVDNVRTLPAMIADRTVPLSRTTVRELTCFTGLIEASSSPSIFRAVGDVMVAENPGISRLSVGPLDHFFPFTAPDLFARSIEETVIPGGHAGRHIQLRTADCIDDHIALK